MSGQPGFAGLAAAAAVIVALLAALRDHYLIENGCFPSALASGVLFQIFIGR